MALIEQDHRGVKFRIGPVLGFKNFDRAAITITGIELLRRIRKGQFALATISPSRPKCTGNLVCSALSIKFYGLMKLVRPNSVICVRAVNGEFSS